MPSMTPTETPTDGSPWKVVSAEQAYIATTPLNLPAETEEIQGGGGEAILSDEVAERVVNLAEGLKELPDVMKVWTNVEGL